MNEKELERVLKAMANRRRLSIVKFLKKEKEASVGNIAAEIRLSLKATSKHLTVLKGARLVDSEQRGFQARYTLVANIPEAARRIFSLL